MTPTEAPSPSLRHLVGDAFRHWADHQRSFWLMAGPCALVIALIKAAAIVGMLNWSGLSVVIALTYIMLLDQWFKQALFDNWKQRAAVLGKDKKTRRSTYASWSFIGFCLAYCVIVAVATFAAVFLLTPTLFRGAFDESMMLISTLALVVIFLLAGPGGRQPVAVPARAHRRPALERWRRLSRGRGPSRPAHRARRAMHRLVPDRHSPAGCAHPVAGAGMGGGAVPAYRHPARFPRALWARLRRLADIRRDDRMAARP
jgi:hypothetical protein